MHVSELLEQTKDSRDIVRIRRSQVIVSHPNQFFTLVPNKLAELSETSTYLLSPSTTVTYSSSYAKRVRLRIGSTFGRFGFTALRTKWDTLSPSREEAHVHEPYGVVGEGRRLLLIAQLRQLGDACLIVIDTGGNHVGSTFGTQQISELA